MVATAELKRVQPDGVLDDRKPKLLAGKRDRRPSTSITPIGQIVDVRSVGERPRSPSENRT
jgi:hypothetical protein